MRIRRRLFGRTLRVDDSVTDFPCLSSLCMIIDDLTSCVITKSRRKNDCIIAIFLASEAGYFYFRAKVQYRYARVFFTRSVLVVASGEASERGTG